MNENSLIIGFRDFIAKNWAYIVALEKLDQSDALRMDWFQANWELLVERHLPLPMTLEVYGDGADNGKSSRIHCPEKPPTHMVTCKPKTGHQNFDCLNEVVVSSKSSTLIFDRFVTLRPDGWYYEEPPFDKVLCFNDSKNRHEIVLSLDEISFEITSTTFF